MPYLSTSAVVFHYEEALYQVYAPLTAKIRGLCLSRSVLSKLAEQYLYMSSASVPVEAVFSTTGLILNGKQFVLASSIELRSFMTIMHSCLILNRQ